MTHKKARHLMQQLTIEEQQWLLIVRARDKTSVDLPAEVRASLIAKGMIGEGDDLKLTALGSSSADSIAAADVDRYKTPDPE